MNQLNESQSLLSDIVTYTKYARFRPELKRRETWDEIIDRYIGMMLKKYCGEEYEFQWKQKKVDVSENDLAKEIIENSKYLYNHEILPSMRMCQFAGVAIEKNNARGYNCAYLPIDHYKAFAEVAFLLLGGSGVGFSVQNRDIEQLPSILKPVKSKKFLIGDSIEGWAEAINTLMKSYFGITRYKPRFDYSDIREKGAPLVTAGGKAPGPEPLRICITKIEAFLNNKEDHSQLSSVEVHDICCHIADAVLAGGIRRAALISLFSFDDLEMATCKHGAWWELNPQRGRCNNSAVIIRDRIKKKEFFEFWKLIKDSNSGEPGILFSSDKTLGTNPCKPLDATILTPEGYITFEEALNRNEDLEVITPDGRIVKASRPFLTGVNREIFEVELTSGQKLLGTDNHKHMLQNGEWVELGELKVGDRLKVGNTKHYDFTVDLQEDKGLYRRKDYETVKSIKLRSREDVYDITVYDKSHSFIDTGIVTHNCCEISLKPNQFCNLTSINAGQLKDQESLNNRVRAASFFGTLQAGFTDFHFLRSIWRKNTEKEALLGVSITGIGSGDILPLDLKEAANVVLEENERVAGIIGINPGARTTTVKPEGCRPATSDSLVTTDEGIFTLPELFNDHEGNGFSDFKSDLTVSGNGNRISKTFNNGMSEVFEIELAGQMVLKSTTNHPWFVKSHYDRRKKESYIPVNDFIKTSDLVPGDIIEVNMNIYHGSDSLLKSINLFPFKMQFANWEINQPYKMNQDMAWLIGYIWGDGCMDPLKYRFRFLDEYKCNLEKVNSIFKTQFGIDGEIEKCKDRNAYTLCISNRSIYYWFIENNIRKYKNESLTEIPLCIRTSSRESIIAFIAGLIDSDGCDDGVGGVMFTQKKCDSFTRQLQQVALTVGIQFNHSENKSRNKGYSDSTIILMSTSSHSIKESMIVLSDNSLKYSPTESEIKCMENCKRLSTTLGKIKSIKSIGLMPTYDVSIENDPWFYAGAYKSHNSGSLVLGTSSGIHAWWSSFYIRNMQCAVGDDLYNYFAENHPELIKVMDYQPNDAVIGIPIKAPKGAILRSEENAEEFLNRVARFNMEWVREGHRSGANYHNVSATCNIKDHEWDLVGEWMWKNRKNYSGISVLPYDGGSYKDAPFQECSEYEYNKRMRYIRANPIDLTKIKEEMDNTNLKGELACAGGKCELTY